MKVFSILLSLCTITCSLSGALIVESGIFSSNNSNANPAVDGNIGTSWHVDSSSSQEWIHLYYEEPITIDSFAISFEGGEQESFRYSVAISENNRDWVALYDSWSSGAGDIFDVVSFPESTGQFIQIRVAKDVDVGIQEFIAGDEETVREELVKYVPIDWGDIRDPEVIFSMIDLAYDWQQERPTTRPIGWIEGAYTAGVMWMYYATGDEQYRQDMLDKCEGYEWTLGEPDKGLRPRHADDHTIGQTYLELFMLDPLEENENWYELLKSCFDEILSADDIDYGNSSKDWWSWCDALFMAPPAWVQMAEVTGDDAYLDLVDDWWWNRTSDLLYDEEENLFYRDYKRISNVEPNGESEFWSRGNGWVVGGLARVLEFMPEDHPTRSMYETQLREMLTRLAGIQSEDGLWRSSLLDPDSFEEPEVSGSAFFVFAMTYAVNNGILDIETFAPVIEQGWEGLASALLSTGEIQWVQQVGADPQPNQEHVDKHYGTGAYLMAGAEVARYYANHPGGYQSSLLEADSAVVMLNTIASTSSVVISGDVNSWELVDDFESGSLSEWSISGDLAEASSGGEIISDPFNSSFENSILELSTGSVQQNRLTAYTDMPSVANNTVATIYQRIAFDETQLDTVWGASHNTAPNTYSHFGPLVRMTRTALFDARESGNYVAIESDFVQLVTWYEMWMVVDQSTDTHDIYIRGGTQYPEISLLAESSEFRAESSNALAHYFIMLNNGSNEATLNDSALYIDDIFVDTSGVNLTRPSSVNQPEYTVWGDALIERYSGAKFTGMEWMYDDPYPWVYNYLLADWLYVSAESHSDRDLYFWSDNEQVWYWHSSDYHRWYYSYGDNDWHWLQ